MSKFGKYSIIDSTEYQFKEEPDWTWVVKPVTSGMELEMAKFMAHNRIVIIQGERHEQPPTPLEVAFREIALTFESTTIPIDMDKPVSDGGKPILKDGASTTQVEQVLNQFPREMLMEVWRAVGQTYPYWGPADPNVE